MGDLADNGDVLIHPALSARRSQIAVGRQVEIRRLTAAALPCLANTVLSLRKTSQTLEAHLEVAQIIAAIEPALAIVSASLKRWDAGEMPLADETDAIIACMQIVYAALDKATELCTGSNVMSVVSCASPNPSCHDLAPRVRMDGELKHIVIERIVT